MKGKNLGIILLGILFLSTISLASTAEVSVIGFESFSRYLTSFFNFIKYVMTIGIGIFFMSKLFELFSTQQWDQFAKALLLFVIIITGIWSTPRVIEAVGGSTVNKNIEKVKVINFEKIKFLGEKNERK